MTPEFSAPKMPFFEKCYWGSLCFLAFALPLFNNLQSIGIAVIAVFWNFSGQYQNAWKRLLKNRVALVWIFYFLLHVLSIFNSTDTQEAIGEVSRKASFIILPILIGSGWFIKDRQKQKTLTWFVYGNIAAFLICIANAFFHFRQAGSGAFFYDDLANILDNTAVYASWKCLFALCILLWQPLDATSFLSRKFPFFGVFILLFLFLLLLSSKTIILLGILIVAVSALYKLFKGTKEFKPVYTGILCAGLTLILMVVIWDNSPIKKRYEDVGNVLHMEKTAKLDISTADNFSKRIVLWKAAWQNISDGGFWWKGTGIGDLQKVQVQRLNNPEFEYKNFYNLPAVGFMNVHNQYLQSWLGLGILGVLSLAFLLLTGLLNSVIFREIVAVLFFAISLIFLAQESALQTQSGIVFVPFFSCIYAGLFYL